MQRYLKKQFFQRGSSLLLFYCSVRNTRLVETTMPKKQRAVGTQQIIPYLLPEWGKISRHKNTILISPYY